MVCVSPGWSSRVCATAAPVSTANVWTAVPSFDTLNDSSCPAGAWTTSGVIANSVSETSKLAGAADVPSPVAASPPRRSCMPTPPASARPTRAPTMIQRTRSPITVSFCRASIRTWA